VQLVDVPAAVRQVIDGRVASGDGDDRFRLSVSGPLPETWLDPDRVAQVFGNLVENAVRHGAGTVAVEVAAAKTSDGAAAVQVSVTDEGRGIDDDIRSRIFSRFWRGGHAGGSGLGLYIVKGIVEAHHGTVEVDEAPAGGALFRVLLPAGAPPWEAPGGD
jgi:signal transduction histidine kinase